MRASECLLCCVPVKQFVRLEHAPADAFKNIFTRKKVLTTDGHGWTRMGTRRAQRVRAAAILECGDWSPLSRRRLVAVGLRRARLGGEHTRPRVSPDAPSHPASGRAHADVKTLCDLVPRRFSARARKTAPEGGCAPRADAGASRERPSLCRCVLSSDGDKSPRKSGDKSPHSKNILTAAPFPQSRSPDRAKTQCRPRPFPNKEKPPAHRAAPENQSTRGPNP